MNRDTGSISYRTLLGLAVLITAAASGFATVYNWRGRSQVTPAPASPTQQPGITFRRLLLQHMEQGKPAWQAQLRELRMAHGSQTLQAQGLEEAIIYSQTGKPIVRVTADQISGHMGRRDFQLTGNVQVASYRAVFIITDKIGWIQDEQRIACPDQVTLHSKQVIITTTNLDYYVAQDLVKCPNEVRMYAGDNQVVGKNLEYNVKTGDFTLESIQMVFHAEEAKQKLRELHSQ